MRKRFFSERNGYEKLEEMKPEYISNETLRRIWNEMYSILEQCKSSSCRSETFIHEYIFVNIMKQTRDNYKYQNAEKIESYLKSIFFKDIYSKSFDILERFVDMIYHGNGGNGWIRNADLFVEKVNIILEEENSAYRIVNYEIVEYTNKEEIKEVEKAIESENKNSVEHISRALSLISEQETKDFRNSIKESISAIEAICRELTGESTLGKALDNLKKNNDINLPNIFIEGLTKIYGWTNGSDGIRHALLEESSLKQEDATFMLVICSAFVNYITEKKRKNKGK